MTQLRWHFGSGGPKVDLVCSADVPSPAGHTLSCARLALGAKKQGPYPIPGGGLTEDDYRKSVLDGGFKGNVIVGTDLTSLRLPQ